MKALKRVLDIAQENARNGERYIRVSYNGKLLGDVDLQHNYVYKGGYFKDEQIDRFVHGGNRYELNPDVETVKIAAPAVTSAVNLSDLTRSTW